MLTTLFSDDGASAHIVHYGAQLTSWIPSGQTEQLFMSAASPLDSGKPLRGGVPVIFPQFSELGPLPRHGFARNLTWTKRATEAGNRAVFVLRDDETTRSIWPHAFLAELGFTVSGTALRMDLTIHNTGNTAFEFTSALHTYLHVAHISDVRISGLKGAAFREAGGEYLETSESLQIAGHVDRVYLNTSPELEVRQSQQRVLITSAGFKDTVVWNPWKDLSETMADMEPHGYERMICVESAAIAQPIYLEPGGVWCGSQQLQSTRL